MIRRKVFVVRFDVAGEFLRAEPQMARALARASLVDMATSPMTGPRGGRYLPDSEPYDYQDGVAQDRFSRDQHTFIARVVGRYVRPKATA